MNLNYVCLYLSYAQTFEPFSSEERGRILTAMLNYAATGEAPVFDGNERYIWPTIQAQIDRDFSAYKDKCSRNRENGAKGGRPSKNQTDILETERFLEKPKKPKEKEKENKKEKEKEKDTYIAADKPPVRPRFIPPTVEDVEQYCSEKGYRVDSQRFVDYYESNGWMVGRNKMKSWQAAVRTWASKEKEKVQPVERKKSSIEEAFPPIPILG